MQDVYIFACQEPKSNGRLRVVKKLDMEPKLATYLYERMRSWNPKLESDSISEFYREDKIHWLVDNVGLLWSTKCGDQLEGHFVFWDGRLRGREMMIRRMAQIFMERLQSDRLVVFVPRAKKMLLSFLFRSGFSMERETDGLCKIYILREVV